MSTTNSGKVAEALFVAHALTRGIVPAWTSTEEEPFDFLCWTGKRCLRVQVKGSRQKGSISLSLKHRGGRSYSKRVLDFFAIYHFDSEAWYLIPVEKLKRKKSISFGGGRWERYRAAWDLLKK